MEPKTQSPRQAGKFDTAREFGYRRNLKNPADRDAEQKELVRQLGAIMFEEFGIATTEEEARQLARSLVTVFGALKRAPASATDSP